MKRFASAFAAGLFLFSVLGQAGQVAQGTLWCMSLRFQRGFDQDGLYYLDLTTLSSGVNGELAPTFDARSYTHWAFVNLLDETFGGETLPGSIGVNVPLAGDANTNGWDDFFEVAQGVTNLSSTGVFSLQVYGQGTLTATWNRPAGSKDGSCVLRLKLNAFQTIVFTHAFELLEYTGPLAYVPGKTNVTGTLNLKQTGNPDNILQGPFEFIKSSTNRFNSLLLSPGTWTNAALLPLTYTTAVYLRDLRLLTNYYGYVAFDDGDPSTAEPDYFAWMFSIDDKNDANHNGIPDFSDDPQTPTPQVPQLSLLSGSTNLLLQISGDTGRVHEIQSTVSLSPPTWQTVLSVTLSNSPQSVLLPWPAEATRFWRARTQ